MAVKLVSTGRAAALVVLLLLVSANHVGATPVAYARHVSGRTSLGIQVDGVSIVNLSTGTLVKTLPIACVDDFAVSPDGSRLFSVCGAGRVITAFDTASGVPVKSLQLEDAPQTIDITPDGTRLLVGGMSGWVIDATTLKTVMVFRIRASRWSFPPAGSPAYVQMEDFVIGSGSDDHMVYAVDPSDGSVVRTFKAPISNFDGAWWFRIAPDGRTGWIFETSGGMTLSHHLIAFDTVTGAVSDRTSVGYDLDFPVVFGFDRTGSRLWLGVARWRQLILVDAVTHEHHQVAQGITPSAVAFSQDGRLAYVTNHNGGFVSVLDAATGFWAGINVPVDVVGPIVISELNSLAVLLDGEGRVGTTDGLLDCGANCGNLYPPGAPVILEPIPEPGWTFAGWQGDADCFDGSVVMTDDRTCTAVFRPAGTAVPGNGIELNGDGLADIFLYNPATGSWSMAFANGVGNFGFAGGNWSPEWDTVAAELNGDNLTDLFVYNRSTGFWYQALNAGSGRFTYRGGTFSPGWQIAAGRFRPGQVDDILVYNPDVGGAFVCFVDGAGRFSSYTFFDWSPGWQLRLLDLNGDGLSDVFTYNPPSGLWYSCLNTGPGTFSYVRGSWSPHWTLSAGDFDGNRRDDLFVYNADNGLWFTCLSAGDGTFVYRGGRWSPGQQVFRARFSTAPRDDIFAYDPVTGVWTQWFGDGAGAFSGYASGTWSAGWTIVVADLSSDGVDDVFTYKLTTGGFFVCITNPAGGFIGFVPGRAEPGLRVVAR